MHWPSLQFYTTYYSQKMWHYDYVLVFKIFNLMCLTLWHLLSNNETKPVLLFLYKPIKLTLYTYWFNPQIVCYNSLYLKIYCIHTDVTWFQIGIYKFQVKSCLKEVYSVSLNEFSVKWQFKWVQCVHCVQCPIYCFTVMGFRTVYKSWSC